MNDFNTRFKKHSEELDRNFTLVKRWSFIWAIINTIIILSLIGFGVWVIIMLLRFWGIV